MPAHFENDRKFDSKNSFLDFDAKEKFIRRKNRPVSIQKRQKMLCLRCCFKFIPIRVPFSKSTVFEICRQKMCRFRVNRRPIRHIFHRFQNLPASCERSLKYNRCSLTSNQLFTIDHFNLLIKASVGVCILAMRRTLLLKVKQIYITIFKTVRTHKKLLVAEWPKMKRKFLINNSS